MRKEKYLSKLQSEQYHAAAIERLPEQHNTVIPSGDRLDANNVRSIRRKYFCIENKIIDALKVFNG